MAAQTSVTWKNIQWDQRRWSDVSLLTQRCSDVSAPSPAAVNRQYFRHFSTFFLKAQQECGVARLIMLRAGMMFTANRQAERWRLWGRKKYFCLNSKRCYQVCLPLPSPPHPPLHSALVVTSIRPQCPPPNPRSVMGFWTSGVLLKVEPQWLMCDPDTRYEHNGSALEGWGGDSCSKGMAAGFQEMFYGPFVLSSPSCLLCPPSKNNVDTWDSLPEKQARTSI